MSRYDIRPVSREEFLASIDTANKADKFAHTFRAKADMLGQWDKCRGIDIDGRLAGAILVTYSKRTPRVANLQLLHTFAAFRGRGVGGDLCRWAVEQAWADGVQYFRVSAEKDAVEFYRKIGFRFWGLQKSGCQLSIFKMGGPTLAQAMYDPEDPVIDAAINSGRKGCVVTRFEEPR